MNIKKIPFISEMKEDAISVLKCIKDYKFPSIQTIKNFISLILKQLFLWLWRNIKEKGKIFLKVISILLIIYIAIYSIIVNNNFLGIMPIFIFSNDKIVYFMLIILTFILSRHLIRLKLVGWRIFLQTFLDIESLPYKFFSHGYLVRLIAVIVSFGLSIKLLTFCTLLRVHPHQYIILCFGITIYIFMNYNSYRSTGYSFIRSDLNKIIKSYLLPFIIASTTAMAVSTYEILNIDNVEQISNFSQALEMSITQISKDEISWPLRVVVRHIYAYELIIQQVINIPVFGKPIYFAYVVISEGFLTFFAIFLLIMPYRKEKNHEKN